MGSTEQAWKDWRGEARGVCGRIGAIFRLSPELLHTSHLDQPNYRSKYKVCSTPR